MNQSEGLFSGLGVSHGGSCGLQAAGYRNSLNPISYLLSSTRSVSAAVAAGMVLLATFGGTQEAKAQYQVTTLGTAVVENFNGMLVPSATSGVTNINFNAALGNTTGAQRNAAWSLTSSAGRGNDTGSNTSGGWRAYADANGTDKALGILGNANLTAGNATATFVNTSGSTVTSFVFSYTGEQWRGNTGPGSITVQYSINGGAFTALSTSTFNAANTTSGATNGDAAGNRTTGLGATVNNITLNNNQNIQFRIEYTVGSNSKGVGADDISVTFNGAAATPTITTSGTLSAVNTTYGSASSSPTSFTVSGSNLTGNLTVEPPSGFEVSTTVGSGYTTSLTLTATSGSVGNTTVYVRLAATATAGSSPYSGNITVSGGGATTQNVATASSTVSKKALTITANNQTVSYGTAVATVTGGGSYTATGFVNGDTTSVIGGSATFTTTYTTTTAAGSNVATITPVTTSLTATNYSFSAANGNITVTAVVPGAPAITGITAGNGQLSVAFTAPSSNGGASITNYEYSTNGGTNWTTPSPAVTSSPLLITGLANGTPYNVQIRAVNSAGSGTATASVAGTPAAPASPTISVSPATFASALTTTYGTASSTANFTVSGSTLSGNLTVTAPTGLQVSLTVGGSYTDSLELTATSGTVTATTVYARLKANAAAGTYNSQNIAVSGGSAEAQNISTSSSGNTVAPKVITITGIAVANKQYDRGTSATITGTAAYSGLVNSESFSVTGTPSASFADKTVANSKPVTVSGYTAPSSNYSISQPTGLTANITAVALSVTGASATTRAYDATTTVAITGGSLSAGVIAGDTVTLGGTPTGSVASAAVGTGKSVTVTGYSITGADSGNYSLSQPTGLSVDITKANQTISGVTATTNQTVGTTYALSATVNSGLTLSYSSSNTGVATVDSSGNVTVVGVGSSTLTVSQAGDGNYNAATSATQTLTAVPPPIWTNPITATDPSLLNPYTTGDVKNANVTVSGIGRGTGITASSAGNRYSASGWNSGSLDANDYFYFTITPSAGYQVSFTSFVYTSQASSATGMSFAVRSSVDNYASNIGTATATGTTIDLSGVNFQNVSSAITFRLYAWGADASTRTFSVNDFSFNGSVDVIPPAITINSGTSGTATAFTTTYGTAATAQNFTIAGSNLTADVTATAPTGFEVSSDGTTYGSTATFTRGGTPASASGTLRVRLAATAGVGGSYNSQTISVASTGATTRNITTAASGNAVSAKGLTITGLSAQNKNWDGTTAATVTGTAAYSGLVNGEIFAISDTVTWAFPDANVGSTKTLTRTGSFSAPSANYSVTQPTLTANISAVVASAPTIDSITAGNGQLSVAFSAPSSSGGASVSNYEYSLSVGGSWTARSPANTASPLIITGLTNGTTYDVQIRAVNSAGSGTASSTVQGAPVAPAVPTITISKASLAAKTTTYGTPSSAETFTVSGVTLTGDNLTVAAPTGFEVSADGTSYSSSLNLTISGGAVAETTLYARLAATAAVTGSYNSQNIAVSGGGADPQNVVTASTGNSVTAKTLTITGLNPSTASKTYDGTTTANVTGTAVYTGLVNGETFNVLDTVTWAFANASVGTGKGLVQTGTYSAPTTNYSVPSQPTLTADITQATAPSLTAALLATVDNSFEVTFTETSSLWRTSISSITVGGSPLSASAYNTTVSGKITFNPALSSLLQSSGSKSIVVVATGHSNGTVTQAIGAGAAVQLSVVTQPTAPASNGAALATQPVVRLLDLYNNVTTSTANVTAAATQGTWTLGGTTTVAAVNGTATFSGLTATSAAAVTGATITFSSTGLTGATSSTFNISAPPAANDTTGTAIALTVGAAATNGSFAGATPTFSSSSTLNDVWYTFVATSTSHTLTVAGGVAGMDPDIRVYEGTGASFDTAPTAYATPAPLVIGQLGGVTEETVIATNFVVGRTYFVMVQEDGTSPGGSFTIRVRTASASIATWNPTWSGTATSPLDATSSDANLSSKSIARTGLTGASNNSRYSATGWNTTANYLEMTLTAASGYRMDLNDAVLYGNWGSSGTGPSWYVVRSSLDNYASDIGYFDAGSSPLLGAFKLPSTGYAGLSTVGFRIYGSSTPLSSGTTTASTGTGGFSALRVAGSVVQIPSVTAATVAGTVGTALNYNIVASGSPTSYAISSGTLPTGLSLNTTTGAITGTPTAAATGTVVGVTASNSAGTSTAANLTFNIAKGTPTITAAPTASAITYGQTLADSVLSGGTASVAGTFAFTTLATAPNAGTANQNVTFTPTDTTNYNTASTTASVTVNPASLAITAVAKSKVYGAADPALTYTSSGLVGADPISGSLSRTAGENVGTYAIIQGTLSAGANYSISYTGANLTITAAALPAVSWGTATITNSNGVSGFSYLYTGRSSNGISTSYSNNVAPAAAGYYTAVATSTDGNYTGSSTNQFHVAGPVAVADTITKPAAFRDFTYKVSDLLLNDQRIHTNGAVLTTSLSITNVTSGTATAQLSDPDVLISRGTNATTAFTYLLLDSVTGLSTTGSVSVLTGGEVPAFDLQIVRLVSGPTGNTNTATTTMVLDFIGVPNNSYAMVWSPDLTNWVTIGNHSTGPSGSFTVTNTVNGIYTNRGFFRAIINP